MADPMAPSKRQKGMGRWKIKAMEAVTSTAAANDSNRVRMTILLPLARRVDSLKYRPTPKAMKARATSVTNSMCSTISPGIRSNT